MEYALPVILLFDLHFSCKRSGVFSISFNSTFLFTPNFRVTEQYIHPAPHTASLPMESPGRVGVWLGFPDYQLLYAA
jgi:hypothetical protein